MQQMIEGFVGVAKTLAGRLTNQNFRFVVLLVIVASSFAVYATTDSPDLAIALLVVGLLTLLIGLLLGQKNPTPALGANQIFVVLLVYLGIVVLLVIYMYFTFQRLYSPAQAQEVAWSKAHHEDAVALSEGLLAHLRAARVLDNMNRPLTSVTPDQLTRLTNEYALENETNRVKLYSVALALESFELCRAMGECADRGIEHEFDKRLREFWHNFKCSIAQIREVGGYNDTFLAALKLRYETKVGRTEIEPVKDSFAPCAGSITLRAQGCPSTEEVADAETLRSEFGFWRVEWRGGLQTPEAS